MIGKAVVVASCSHSLCSATDQQNLLGCSELDSMWIAWLHVISTTIQPSGINKHKLSSLVFFPVVHSSLES